MKALIVDDVTIMRKLLKNLFNEYAECDLVANGKEAIKLFKSALQSGKPYDLLCLDIMMPGMNGLEILKEIRKIESGSKKVKILMTTAVTDHDNVLKAIEYGCDGYISKPYNKQNIVKQLAKLDLLDQDRNTEKSSNSENE